MNRKTAYIRIGMTLLPLLLLFALLVGCADDDADDNDDGALRTDEVVLRIVATTTQAGDLAAILSDGVTGIELNSLMGAGVDPHLYQPTQGDIFLMNQADLIIYSGLHLEGQFDRVFEALGEQGVFIHRLTEAVEDAGFVIGTIGNEGTADPHFWFDPRNWSLSVTGLAELLAGFIPAQAEIVRSNAEGYIAQLELLYSWADQGMRSVPAVQRHLVTSHDAFQYFGAAFGWKMAAIQGLSTQDAAGVGDIQGTVDFVLEKNIPVLFVESSIPPDTIDAVIEAIDAGGGTISRGMRELFSDAMGDPGSFGGTYIGMIAHNVYTILQSYQLAGADATIPPWPNELLPQPSTEILEARK